MSAKEEYIKPIEEFARLAKSMDYDMECISTNDYFHIHVLNPNFDGFFALVHDSYRSMQQPLDIMKNTIKKKEENIFQKLSDFVFHDEFFILKKLKPYS